jgi:transposase
VPKQHSSGGKERLGSISKQGDRYADLAKETYKPLEGYVAKITPAK